jgi:hypothetical protein
MTSTPTDFEGINRIMQADPKRAFSMILTSTDMLYFCSLSVGSGKFTDVQLKALHRRQKQISAQEIKGARNFDDLMTVYNMTSGLNEKLERLVWVRLIRFASNPYQAKIIHGHEKFPKEFEQKLIVKWRRLLAEGVAEVKAGDVIHLLTVLTDIVDPRHSETHVNEERVRRWG